MADEWKPAEIAQKIAPGTRPRMSIDSVHQTEYGTEIARANAKLLGEMLKLEPKQKAKIDAGFEEDVDRVNEALRNVSDSKEGLTSEKKGPFDRVRTGASRIAAWNIMRRVGEVGATTDDALALGEYAVQVASRVAYQGLRAASISVDESVIGRVAMLDGKQLFALVAGEEKDGLVPAEDYAGDYVKQKLARNKPNEGVLRAGAVGALLANVGWNAVQPMRAAATGDRKYISETASDNYGSFPKMVAGMYNRALNGKSQEVAFARAVYEVIKDIGELEPVITQRHLHEKGENKAVDLVRMRVGANGDLEVRVLKRKEDGLTPNGLKPWSLPGGFVDKDESDEAAVLRETIDEVHETADGELVECFPRQKVDDPRNIDGDRWITSRAFMQFVTTTEATNSPPDDETAEGTQTWVPAAELMKPGAMYGSHSKIVQAAVEKLAEQK